MPSANMATVGKLLALNLTLIPVEQRGKRPAVAWKRYQTTPPTADELETWFGNGHHQNIGILTGATSGIVVVDTDSREAEAHADEHLPATPMMTQTAKGTHRFFRHPGAPVRNKARIKTGDDRVHIDVRGDGGYVVGPGSVHETGAVYEMVGTWPSTLDALPVFDPAWLAPETSTVVESSQVIPRNNLTDQPDREHLLRRASAYLRATPPAVQGQGGDAHTYQVACRLVRGFDLAEHEARDLLAEWNSTCQPPWSPRELDAKIDGALKYGTEPIGARADQDMQPHNLSARVSGITRTSAHDTGPTESGIDIPSNNDTGKAPASYPNTDTGNGEFFAARHGHEVRFDHQRGRWLLWTSPIWAPDADAGVRRLAKDTVRERFRATELIGDLEAKKQAARWAITSESRPRLDAVLYEAQSEPPIADAGTGWDADPFLLAVRNGVVDLRDGTLRAGKQTDRLTMQTAIRYDAMAACRRFDRFLDEVFASDQELINYLQRVCGYCLTGDTREQCFWMFYGGGSNGKSTLGRVLTRVLGTYGYTAPFSTFAKDHRASISNDLAALDGRRFVWASEPNERDQLNEGRLKSLTGGDIVTARFLHEEFFQFSPVLKLFLAVNHRPVVKDDSHGMWRRVRVVPFLQRFPLDTSLEDELAAEDAGILAWAVRGCLDWQRDGLQTPSSVQAATSVYEEDSDPLADFLDEACEQHGEAEVSAAELFRHYTAWADQAGLTVRDRLTATMFGRKMTERFRWDKTKAGKAYFGVRKTTSVTGLDQ